MTLVPPLTRELRVQPIACCIFRHQGAILVLESFDPDTQQPCYDLPGGKLVFGEYSWETVRKQIKRTLGEEIDELTFLGPAEHVQMHADAATHEIAFMFEGKFLRRKAYQPELSLQNSPTHAKAVWVPLTAFKRKKVRLRKAWLLDMM